jgi:multisubunit Na+/H+ antiporter MnhB subunit
MSTPSPTLGRSPAIGLGVRAVTPLALLAAVHLFFAGHNRPGGGFAAGLVVGAVLGLRLMAGLSFPGRPSRFLAGGAMLVGLTALAPLLWGDALLDQIVADATVPVLGKVKSGTALVFDAGVVLIVVGLVVAVLDGLGADELQPTPEEP